MSGKPFWKRKRLDEMTREEWELLCDNCGRCCLLKLEDAETAEIHYSDVACKLLDHESCRCSKYPRRHKYVPDCVVLTPENLKELDWMPSTCAYRLLRDGKELYWWHPLVSGDRNTVHLAGISVRGRAIAEGEAEPEDRIVDWPK